MKKVIILLVAFIFIFTGCNTPDFLDEVSHRLNNNKELILYHESTENEKYENKSMYDAICFYATSDSNKNNYIIQSYLQQKGMYKENPEGITYYNNQKIGEYYINDEKGKFLLYYICGIIGPILQKKLQ